MNIDEYEFIYISSFNGAKHAQNQAWSAEGGEGLVSIMFGLSKRLTW